MSHVSHVVSMHHDAGSHSPEIVTIHDSTDHFQNITHDSSAMSEPSSPESATFDDSDLLNSSVTDVVTSQLAAAGPVGVAAAAAVATGRKRKRPHSFETNPSIRKRQQTRLLRKLKGTIDEYATRVGQQAVVLCACPGTPNPLFKVFGAAPLENCVKSLKPHILQSLEGALAQQTPTPSQDNNGLFELPPLYIDGIPTPVDKMTQAQLRAFIPLMLKYSTGRGKPGWGRESTKPPWWPEDIPWQNVRSDTRTEEQKAKLSWTNALRTTVKNCYEYHGRSDLLPDFQDGERYPQVQGTHPIVHTLTNADGTLSLVQVDATGAIVSSYTDGSTQAESTQAVATLSEVSATTQGTPVTISITEMSQGEAAAQAAVATLAEATLSDGGQLVISEHAANALAGVSESSLNTSSMVNIPVHAAAAMMQIQNSQIANAQTQYIATSIPQVAMAPHSNLNTVSAAQNIQTQLVDSTGSDNPVPGASQAVEVFGAAPLENCVKSLKPHILQSLEGALAQQTPTPSQDNNGLFQLPPLCIHGIPTPVDKMTQAQLRAFIPLMLKYSTGRGKPKWGCESTKPPWWPEHIPWQNVRSDTRTEKQKAKLSWMNALRMIVRNCYVYHGRSDMLPDCQDGGKPETKKTAHSAKTSSKPRGRSKSPSKKKSKKKGKAKSRSASPTKSNVDLMSKPAMENAYYISHNAPQFLELRGFSWEGSGPKSKKKGKKKGKKKK